jgi:hypothetical protein
MPFNRLNHSVLGEIRPRFDLIISCEPEIALEHIYQKTIQDPSVGGVRSRQYVFVKTPTHLQHYWSPEMSVRIEKSEFSDEIRAHCLLGPRQTIWAMFTLIYAAILLLTLFGGMFGIIQYQNSGDSLFIYCFPIGFVLFLSIFITSKLGQRKGRDQMLHLVSFVYHSLEEVSNNVERVE